MKRLAFLLLLFAAACASSPSYERTSRPELWVYISNHNWDASRVILYCDNVKLTTIWGLVHGGRIRRRVSMGNCRTIHAVVYNIGGARYDMREHTMMVDRNDTICITLEAHITLSTAYNCTQRTLDVRGSPA